MRGARCVRAVADDVIGVRQQVYKTCKRVALVDEVDLIGNLRRSPRVLVSAKDYLGVGALQGVEELGVVDLFGIPGEVEIQSDRQGTGSVGGAHQVGEIASVDGQNV